MLGLGGTSAPSQLLYNVMMPSQETDLTSISPTRLWVPKHVMITRAAADLPHTAEILRRCERAGIEDIRFLPGNALTGLRGASER